MDLKRNEARKRALNFMPVYDFVILNTFLERKKSMVLYNL